MIKVVFLLALSLIGCAGGGGGGDDQSSSSDRGIRVLHGALELSPVDLYINGESGKFISRAGFGVNSGYQRVPDGVQSFTLTRATRPSEVLYNFGLDVKKDASYSLLVVESGSSTSYALVADGKGDLDSDLSYVRVINALDGAGILELLVNGAGLSSAQFATAGEYATVQPGLNNFEVRRVADREVVYRSSATLDAKKTYSIFVGGEIGYFVSASVLDR